MIFWLLAICLSAASAAAIAYFLLTGGRGSFKSAELDVAVYKQQLKELDREIRRGIVSPGEAEASRLEISRRILHADKVARGEMPPGKAPEAASIACLAAVFALLVPGSALLYGLLGSPGLPDLPQAKRIENAENYRLNRPSQTRFLENSAPRRNSDAGLDPEYAELIERLRNTVASRPGDIQGHRLLARHESTLGNFSAAAAAMERIIALIGELADCDEYVDLAEYMILAADGYVSPEAEAALEDCLSTDSSNSRARYFMGLMRAQTGRPDIAFEIWSELLEQGSGDARWRQALDIQIVQVAELAGVRFEAPPQPIPGPSAAEMAAASELDPADRAAMIEGMVSGLESRLAENGGSIEEWMRLIRSLGVLGEIERAEAARKSAIEAFSADSEALARIARTARESGLRP